jgi:hypothetical protein
MIRNNGSRWRFFCFQVVRKESMTAYELAQRVGFEIRAGEAEAKNREVSGVYTCDLLSHAMAKVKQGDIWITVHTNLNVVAVASLTDAACVLIPESIEIEQQSLERAMEKEVVFLSCPWSAARACHEVLKILETL